MKSGGSFVNKEQKVAEEAQQITNLHHSFEIYSPHYWLLNCLKLSLTADLHFFKVSTMSWIYLNTWFRANQTVLKVGDSNFKATPGPRHPQNRSGIVKNCFALNQNIQNFLIHVSSVLPC